jgi:hypothetical protein
VIYVEEGLGAVRTHHPGEEEVVEAATVQVSWGGGSKLTICQVYRKQNDVENTLGLLKYLAGLPDQTVTVGDYNFPTIRWEEGRGGTEEESRFLELLEERGWEQRVRGVTRPLGGNTLDLATGPVGLIEEYELLAPLGVSVHKAVQVWLGGWQAKTVSSVEQTPVWSKVNWVELLLQAGRIQWKQEVAGPHLARGDPLAAMEAMYKEIRGLQNSFIPLCRRRSRTRPKWATQATRQAVKEKLRLWKQAESGGQGDMKERLKEASRKLYRATRKARRDYENKIARSEDRRLLYGYIKSKVQNRVSVGPLKNKEGKEVKESKEMADLLAEHYSSVFKKEVLPMQEIKQLYEGDSPLLETQFTEASVRLQLSRLRETLATGPDGIFLSLLKRICIYISETLADIFNCLLQQSKVPLIWLDSHITPTHKPGKSKINPASYRPIGVTCTLGRVFERQINHAIDCHLERNNLINDSQHGFRRGRSCETNLLVLMEYHAQRAEDGDDEDNCYFDLRAFFDGIPHQRCLVSLHSHGVLEEGKIHRWIRVWLGAGGELTEPGARRQEKKQGDRIQEKEEAPSPVRRRQRVILNGEASRWHEVTASIIQGSVLGPTLAKCFSNSSHQGRNLTPEDKPMVSKFADDEKRGRVVKNEEQGKRMQEDIDHMVAWTNSMGVELNNDKVHVLHIGRTNQKRQYTLGEGGPVIETVEQEKDLGVIISNEHHRGGAR